MDLWEFEVSLVYIGHPVLLGETLSQNKKNPGGPSGLEALHLNSRERNGSQVLTLATCPEGLRRGHKGWQVFWMGPAPFELCPPWGHRSAS